MLHLFFFLEDVRVMAWVKNTHRSEGYNGLLWCWAAVVLAVFTCILLERSELHSGCAVACWGLPVNAALCGCAWPHRSSQVDSSCSGERLASVSCHLVPTPAVPCEWVLSVLAFAVWFMSESVVSSLLCSPGLLQACCLEHRLCVLSQRLLVWLQCCMVTAEIPIQPC